MDEHDINGAKAIVLYLCRSGLRWYRNGARPRAWEDTYRAIGDRFRIYLMEDEVAGTLLQGREVDGVVDGEIRDRFILLAPPGGHPVVCLLGIRWRLSAETVEMTLYLHLFGQSQQRGVSTWHRGYRLELPHRRGSHTFTHVQPVRATGWQQRVAVPFAEQSIPENFPAFPLRGSNLTTLCAALAIALDAKDLPNVVRALKGCRKQSDVQSFFACLVGAPP